MHPNETFHLMSRGEIAAHIAQKRPIPYPVALRFARGEYRRGVFHALAAVAALALVVALAGAWPW